MTGGLVLTLTLASATSLAAQSSATYRVTHSYTLGGDGRWDYVVRDPTRHRLFTARQTRVMVVDEDSGKLLGEVAGIQGAHGTAWVEAVELGFATSGDDQSVVIFDLPPRMPMPSSTTAPQIAFSHSTATRTLRP